MRIPKIFIKDGSEKYLEKMLNSEKDSLFDKKVYRLLSSCYDFLELECGNTDIKYDIGEKFANKLVYTLKDVEDLSKRMSLKPLQEPDVESLGFYFSALINKVITAEDVITMAFDMGLSGIGSHLAKGNVVVHGDMMFWTGTSMAGGKLTVFGNVRDYTGYEMTNGVIVVSGSTGGTVGYMAQGGEMYFDEIEGMVSMSCKASVYKNGEKVWPRVPSKY